MAVVIDYNTDFAHNLFQANRDAQDYAIRQAGLGLQARELGLRGQQMGLDQQRWQAQNALEQQRLAMQGQQFGQEQAFKRAQLAQSGQQFGQTQAFDYAKLGQQADLNKQDWTIRQQMREDQLNQQGRIADMQSRDREYSTRLNYLGHQRNLYQSLLDKADNPDDVQQYTDKLNEIDNQAQGLNQSIYGNAPAHPSAPVALQAQPQVNQAFPTGTAAKDAHDSVAASLDAYNQNPTSQNLDGLTATMRSYEQVNGPVDQQVQKLTERKAALDKIADGPPEFGKANVQAAARIARRNVEKQLSTLSLANQKYQEGLINHDGPAYADFIKQARTKAQFATEQGDGELADYYNGLADNADTVRTQKRFQDFKAGDFQVAQGSWNQSQALRDKQNGGQGQAPMTPDQRYQELVKVDRSQKLAAKMQEFVDKNYANNPDGAMAYINDPANKLLPTDRQRLLDNQPAGVYAKNKIAMASLSYPGEDNDAVADRLNAIGVEKAKLRERPPTAKELADNPELLDYVNNLIANSKTTSDMKAHITHKGSADSTHMGASDTASGGVNISAFPSVNLGDSLTLSYSKGHMDSQGVSDRDATRTVNAALAKVWSDEVYKPTTAELKTQDPRLTPTAAYLALDKAASMHRAAATEPTGRTTAGGDDKTPEWAKDFQAAEESGNWDAYNAKYPDNPDNPGQPQDNPPQAPQTPGNGPSRATPEGVSAALERKRQAAAQNPAATGPEAKPEGSGLDVNGLPKTGVPVRGLTADNVADVAKEWAGKGPVPPQTPQVGFHQSLAAAGAQAMRLVGNEKDWSYTGLPFKAKIQQGIAAAARAHADNPMYGVLATQMGPNDWITWAKESNGESFDYPGHDFDRAPHSDSEKTWKRVEQVANVMLLGAGAYQAATAPIPMTPGAQPRMPTAEQNAIPEIDSQVPQLGPSERPAAIEAPPSPGAKTMIERPNTAAGPASETHVMGKPDMHPADIGAQGQPVKAPFADVPGADAVPPPPAPPRQPAPPPSDMGGAAQSAAPQAAPPVDPAKVKAFTEFVNKQRAAAAPQSMEARLKVIESMPKGPQQDAAYNELLKEATVKDAAPTAPSDMGGAAKSAEPAPNPEHPAMMDKSMQEMYATAEKIVANLNKEGAHNFMNDARTKGFPYAIKKWWKYNPDAPK